jgi:hypothetical protein
MPQAHDFRGNPQRTPPERSACRPPRSRLPNGSIAIRAAHRHLHHCVLAHGRPGHAVVGDDSQLGAVALAAPVGEPELAEVGEHLDEEPTVQGFGRVLVARCISPTTSRKLPTVARSEWRTPGSALILGSMDTEIRPFIIDFPQEDLDDLRHRVARTRWAKGAHNPLPDTEAARQLLNSDRRCNRVRSRRALSVRRKRTGQPPWASIKLRAPTVADLDRRLDEMADARK